MQRTTIILISIFMIASSYAFSQSFEINTDEAIFFEKLNEERNSVGLNALTLNPTLVQTAREHSREMFELSYFSHISPTSSLKSPMKRYILNLGYIPEYAFLGENLFYCSNQDALLGHRKLMESISHRENILNPKFDEVGIGIYIAPNGEYYVTQMFLKQTYEQIETINIVSSDSITPANIPSFISFDRKNSFTRVETKNWFSKYQLNILPKQI